MAKMICTIREFTFFVDPRVRMNITSMTKQIKGKLGSRCQKCNEANELDAAHKHGKSRKEIIKQVLENYKTFDGKYEINDLKKVIDEINNAHLPIEDTFLFLCKKCHREYDSWTSDLNNAESKKPLPSKKISNKISQTKNKANSIKGNNLSQEILCKQETNSWKYKLGWTSIQNRKNIEELISKIESNFDCNPLAFKSWYFHKRTDNNKQFSGIICNKNNSLLCFRIEPSSFKITDNRIIRGKRWFFPEGKEGRIEILPQNHDLIMKCLFHAYDISS